MLDRVKGFPDIVGSEDKVDKRSEFSVLKVVLTSIQDRLKALMGGAIVDVRSLSLVEH